jgi:hypothetical protein
MCCVKPVELYAPQSYIQATPEERRQVVNGCGAGGWLRHLVPDRIYGLKVEEACDIHDWMYATGLTIEDKELADRVFLNNLLRIIDANTRWGWLRRLRYLRARKYFEAVQHFGGPAFWKGKNQPEELFTYEPISPLSYA